MASRPAFLLAARRGYASASSGFPRHRNPTAWQVLGLEEGASTTQVKSAYYKLVRLHHPDVKSADSDKNHPLSPSERFHYLQTAYECLRKEPSRGTYLRNQSGWTYSSPSRAGSSSASSATGSRYPNPNWQPNPSYRPPGSGSSSQRNTNRDFFFYHGRHHTEWERRQASDRASRAHNPETEWKTENPFRRGEGDGSMDWKPPSWVSGFSKSQIISLIVFSMLLSWTNHYLSFSPEVHDRHHREAAAALSSAHQEAALRGDWRPAVRRRLEELKRLEEERQEGDPPFSAGGFQIEHLEDWLHRHHAASFRDSAMRG